MTRRRRTGWLIAVGLSCFAAGVGVGLGVPIVAEAMVDDPTPDPDESYVREMARGYRLSRDQVRLLRMVLAKRHQEIIEIFSKDPQRLPPELNQLYRDVMTRADERIEHVLDEDQRRQYIADLPRQVNR